jgi:Fur family ferric uptake transcriptional regulator
MNEQRMDLLERHMAEKGLKSTKQRSVIIESFFKQGGHLSVEEVWTRVRQENPRVSVATVYRTMKLLLESGLVRAQNFGDGQTRFEAALGREHHDHLICTQCGTIVEFENDQIERLQESVARRHGFRVESHKMELYGLCRQCGRGAEDGRNHLASR